jgi:hypothetical protein
MSRKGSIYLQKKHRAAEKNIQFDKYAGNENLIWFSIFLMFDRRERRNQDSMTFITVNKTRKRGTGKRFLFVSILKFIVGAVAM